MIDSDPESFDSKFYKKDNFRLEFKDFLIKIEKFLLQIKIFDSKLRAFHSKINLTRIENFSLEIYFKGLLA